MCSRETRNRFHDLPVQLQLRIFKFRHAWVVFERLLRPSLRRSVLFVRARWVQESWFRGSSLTWSRSSLHSTRCHSDVERPLVEHIRPRDERFTAANFTTLYELHMAMFGLEPPSRRNRKARGAARGAGR